MKRQEKGININMWLLWAYTVRSYLLVYSEAGLQLLRRHMVYILSTDSSSPAFGILNHHAAVSACGVQGKRNQDRCPGRVLFGEGILESSPNLVGLRPGYSYTVHGSNSGAWACCVSLK